MASKYVLIYASYICSDVGEAYQNLKAFRISVKHCYILKQLIF